MKIMVFRLFRKQKVYRCHIFVAGEFHFVHHLFVHKQGVCSLCARCCDKPCGYGGRRHGFGLLLGKRIAQSLRGVRCDDMCLCWSCWVCAGEVQRRLPGSSDTRTRYWRIETWVSETKKIRGRCEKPATLIIRKAKGEGGSEKRTRKGRQDRIRVDLFLGC